MYPFPNLEPVFCLLSSSNCCFLTCIHISQETGQMFWYSHQFKNFPHFVMIHISSVQSLSHFWLFVTPMDCSMSGFLVHHQIPKLAQTHVHQVDGAIQPSHSLSLLFLSTLIFPSTRVFSSESVLISGGQSIGV